MIEERRKLSRWQINRQAKIKLEGAESFADCRIKELNLKGMQVCLGLKLAKDTFIKFCLFLAEECILEAESWVVWHKVINDTNFYGFYFTRIKDCDKEKIYKFVCKHSPELIKGQYCQDKLHPALFDAPVSATAEGGENMPGQSFEDKRIFERFSVKFPLRFFNLNSNTDGAGKVYDISAKGVGLVTNEQLPAHTPLELWLQIPDKSEPLYVRGNVVWSNMAAPSEYRAGVNLEKAELLGLSRVLRTI